MKTKNLKVTDKEIEVIKSITDDISAMVGGGDQEANEIWAAYVKAIDRMLKRNGLKRNYK